MDYSLYRAINGLSGYSPLDHVARVLANDLPAILIAVVAALFLVPWPRARLERRCGAVAATAAAAIALLISQPIAHTVARVRPYIAHPGHAHLLVARSHDPSFPSDHATGAFAIATAVFLYDRSVGIALFVLAALLAFARVYVGTHYPGDVAGGALIGVAVALLLYLPAPRRVMENISRRCSELWERLLRMARVPS
jgi:undecaprenyl-diphosphatase